MSELKVTTFEELKRIAEGEVVELPPFAGNNRFVARLKVPSLTEMIATGKIPNRLATEVIKMFEGKEKKDGKIGVNLNSKEGRKLITLARKVAKEALVEPTMKEIEEAGLKLTDTQALAIYNYVDEKVIEAFPFR